jgi:hypothetical protein
MLHLKLLDESPDSHLPGSIDVRKQRKNVEGLKGEKKQKRGGATLARLYRYRLAAFIQGFPHRYLSDVPGVAHILLNPKG